MGKPTVVEFKRDDRDDALSTLKSLVARLESGEQSAIALGCLVIYDTDSALLTYGLGSAAGDLQLIALLELGKVQLVDGVFGG